MTDVNDKLAFVIPMAQKVFQYAKNAPRIMPGVMRSGSARTSASMGHKVLSKIPGYQRAASAAEASFGRGVQHLSKTMPTRMQAGTEATLNTFGNAVSRATANGVVGAGAGAAGGVALNTGSNAMQGKNWFEGTGQAAATGANMGGQFGAMSGVFSGINGLRAFGGPTVAGWFDKAYRYSPAARGAFDTAKYLTTAAATTGTGHVAGRMAERVTGAAPGTYASPAAATGLATSLAAPALSRIPGAKPIVDRASAFLMSASPMSWFADQRNPQQEAAAAADARIGLPAQQPSWFQQTADTVTEPFRRIDQTLGSILPGNRNQRRIVNNNTLAVLGGTGGALAAEALPAAADTARNMFQSKERELVSGAVDSKLDGIENAVNTGDVSALKPGDMQATLANATPEQRQLAQQTLEQRLPEDPNRPSPSGSITDIMNSAGEYAGGLFGNLLGSGTPEAEKLVTNLASQPAIAQGEMMSKMPLSFIDGVVGDPKKANAIKSFGANADGTPAKNVAEFMTNIKTRAGKAEELFTKVAPALGIQPSTDGSFDVQKLDKALASANAVTDGGLGALSALGPIGGMFSQAYGWFGGLPPQLQTALLASAGSALIGGLFNGGAGIMQGGIAGLLVALAMGLMQDPSAMGDMKELFGFGAAQGQANAGSTAGTAGAPVS